MARTQYRRPIERNIDFHREFLYIHIPKTAGTAIKKGLGLTPVASHAKYYQFESGLGKKKFDRFYKIAFVRNPWDRFLSFYLYARMEENYYHSNKNPETSIYGKNRHYDLLINASLNDCVHYLIEGRFKPLKGEFYFLAPQTDWIMDDQGALHVDFVGKYEDIEEDFNILKERLQLDDAALEVINTSKRGKRDFRQYYDPETRNLIAKYYERDIDRLEYTFS